VSVSAALASAFFAVGASSEPLSLERLPAGEAPAPPERRAAPFAIGATSVAEGLFRVDSQRVLRRNMPGFREYTVFDDPARARAYEKELMDGEHTGFARSDTCFATPASFRAPEENDPRPLQWNTFSADSFTAQIFTNDQSAKVFPVRADRWVEADGHVRIETTRFWIDARTGGTRLIARTTSETERVALPFTGVSVQALRTGADRISFFVRRDAPRDPSAPNLDLLGQIGGMQLSRIRGQPVDPRLISTSVEGDNHVSTCSFERVDLELRPDAAPDPVPGPTPSARAASKPSRKHFSPFGMNRGPSEMANVAFAVVLGIDSEPPITTADSPAPVGGQEPHGTASVRTMLVNLGLARTPSGAQPSVSYRWLDAPRVLVF
jgi:hypothetical protein